MKIIESVFQQVSDLVKISIDLFKEIFLHVIPVLIVVPWYTITYSFLARNQEFFRAGEVSENKGTSVNI